MTFTRRRDYHAALRRLFKKFMEKASFHGLSSKRRLCRFHKCQCSSRFVRITLLIVLLLILSLLTFMSFFTFCFEPIPDWSWMLNQRSPLHVYVKPEEDTLLLAPNPLYCDKDVFLVIIVCSSLTRFENRQAIRETWASKLNANVRVVFLVGSYQNSSQDKTVNISKLKNESQFYGDIVQEEFSDTYNNLTIKSVMLLKWELQYCHKAKFVMKVDDDVFLNFRNLMKFMEFNSSPNLFVGFRFTVNSPYATCLAKNYIPHAIYKSIFFPKFLFGPSYLMSQSVAQKLYPVALRTPFLYVEDLFLTGLCASEAGVERQNHVGFLYLLHFFVDRCKFREVSITEHLKENAPRKMRKLWAFLNNASVECTPTLIEEIMS